jgi:hypothetical protein
MMMVNLVRLSRPSIWGREATALGPTPIWAFVSIRISASLKMSKILTISVGVLGKVLVDSHDPSASSMD